MKTTALIAKPGQWRLLRDISGNYLYYLLSKEGFTLVESWPFSPSVDTVLAAVSRYETITKAA